MTHKITEDCIGCTLCAKNCPVGAIAGTLKEQHHINEKRCVDCGVCSRLCAKSAIEDSEGKRGKRIPKEKWPKPVIEHSQCSACSMCVDICSFDCLSISFPVKKGDLAVFSQLTEPDKCVGCGLCAKICPLNIITMKNIENSNAEATVKAAKKAMTEGGASDD